MSPWNGLDILSSREVLDLSRPDAARWWCECADPGGYGQDLTDDEVRDYALLVQRRPLSDAEANEWMRAYLYAAECAGVLS